jgi:hypothetical protein
MNVVLLCVLYLKLVIEEIYKKSPTLIYFTRKTSGNSCSIQLCLPILLAIAKVLS